MVRCPFLTIDEEADSIDDDALLHMLHLGGNPLIRTIRIRPPSVKCVACGPEASVNVEEYDYATFCSGPAGAVDEDWSGSGAVGERISVQVSPLPNLSWATF